MWPKIIAFIIIAGGGGIALPGEFGVYWLMLCWAVVIVAFLRRRYVKAQIERKLEIDYSPSRIPAVIVPLAYVFQQIEPAISFLLLKRGLRRSERIRAFLKLADDVRVRKQSVDRRLPGGPGR
jgi:hypothetical protein